MIEIVAAHGYEGVTVRGLTKRARVSSGTFYKHYSSTEDCLLCTYDQICGRASRRMTEAAESEPDPERRLAAVVERLFEDISAAPQPAAFTLRAAATVGPAFTNELWTSAMRLGAALELCLRGEGDPPLDPLLLEGIVAGLARIGSTLGPAAGEGEIQRTTVEAVEWVMSASGPLDQELLDVPAPPEHRGGLRAPSRLRNGDWQGMLGDKRSMLLAATFWIARRGYDELSVSRVCREAGVSRRDFNRHFESLEDCFIAAVEERVAAAIDACDSPRDVCEAIEGDPTAARVLLVDITSVGTRGIDCRDRLISHAARELRTPESSIAAAWAILRRRLQEQGSATADALPLLTHLLAAREDEKRKAADRKRAAGTGKPAPPLLEFS